MADPKNCARVYLQEARNRRGSGNFYWVLLGWAANARRRAAVKPEQPAQGSLF